MKYIIGFLIVIGLIILVFVLIFRGGGSPAPKSTTDLLKYANSTTVMRLTIDSPVSADQTHHQVRTTVGASQSSLEILNGYQGNVQTSKSYASNGVAYASFLRALNLAGYTSGNSSKGAGDERGYCPEGDRYIFEIINGGQDIQRFWSTSCGNQGTFGGKLGTVLTLFQAQIPDYDGIVNEIAL